MLGFILTDFFLWNLYDAGKSYLSSMNSTKNICYTRILVSWLTPYTHVLLWPVPVAPDYVPVLTSDLDCLNI